MPPTSRRSAAPTNRRDTVERKIHFFRARVGVEESGRPTPLDLAPLTRVRGPLRFSTSERYQDLGDGTVLGVWVDRQTGPGQLRVASIRRSGLPLVEQDGQLSALNIGARAGLYEAAHVCLFPNNIVGMEFNFYGPRVSRLANFLYLTNPGACPRFVLDPLLRQDVVSQLRRLQALKVVDLQVRSSYASSLAQADESLGSAFQAAAEAGGAQTVRVVLAPEPYGRARLADRVKRFVQSVASRTDLRENAVNFTVKGWDEQTGALEAVDLLRDELVSTKRIVRLDGRSRAVDQSAAYAAVNQAYTELREDLEAAAAASVAQ